MILLGVRAEMRRRATLESVEDVTIFKHRLRARRDVCTLRRMKIVERIIRGDAARFESSTGWDQARDEIERAIGCVVWPEGTSDFTIFPKKNENGVVAIKAECMTSLKRDGWQVEQRFKIPGDMNPGPIDAQKLFGEDLVLLEWETGNIASSHRALNKMCLAIRHAIAAAGVLIVPDTELARYLTDRIGNIRELRPYIELWESWVSDFGLLAIYVVSYDSTDETVDRLPKGTDGRERQYRDRLRRLKDSSEPLS